MNKKILLLLCLALVAVIAGASVLYNSLADQVDTAGLATVATAAPTTEPAVEITEEATAPTEEPDYSAPNFSMEDWDGTVVRLADFVGKPIVLNFWASWCGPCKSEMPDFEEAYQKYGDKIHFIMLNCTISDSMDDAKALIEDSGYTFPVYFDTTGEASYAYGTSSIPMTFFINENGELVTYARGALSVDLLEKGIGYIYSEE